MPTLVLADIPPNPPKKGGCAATEGIGAASLLLLALALVAVSGRARRRPA